MGFLKKNTSFFLLCLLNCAFLASQIHSFTIQTSQKAQVLQIKLDNIINIDNNRKNSLLNKISLFENHPVLIEDISWDQTQDKFQQKNTQSSEIQNTKDVFPEHRRYLSIINNVATNQNASLQNKKSLQIQSMKPNPNENEVSKNGVIFSNKQNSPNIKGISLNQNQVNFTTSLFPTIDFNSFLTNNSSQINQNYNPSNINRVDFSQVTLTHNIPDIFLQGQLFLFSGYVNNNQFLNLSDSKVITVAFTDEYLSYKRVYTQKIDNKSSKFQILVQIPQKGRYRIAIFYGLTGSPSSKLYTVIQDEMQNRIDNSKINSTTKGNGAEFQMIQNNLYIKINSKIQKKDNSSFQIFFLKFSQQFQDQVTLIYSNLVQSQYTIKIPYYKFANFYQAFTQVSIYYGESKSLSAINLTDNFRLVGNQSFFATYHQFNQLKTQILQLNSQPPFHINQRGMSLNVTGIIKQQLRNQIVVLQPPKTFKQYEINSLLKQSDKITINSSLDVSFLFDKQGTYIIQINHIDGYAALNQPIYVGYKIYPLLPDFQDLKPYKIDQNIASKKTIDQIKIQILSLINQKRNDFNQSPLRFDQKLNSVAQKHADDMFAKSYIGHYSPDGLGPVDRAKSAGIFQQVSQNIALNSDIEDAHYRLCRSNIHLRNMVRSYWERIGLGITINNKGAYIIVQQYSTRDFTAEPFNKSQINFFKAQIMNALISVSSTIKTINDTLSSDVSEYTRLKSQGLSTQYASVGDYLKSTKRYTKWAYYNIKITYKSQGMIQLIKNQTAILPKSTAYSQIGMSLQYSSGFFVLYFAFI